MACQAYSSRVPKWSRITTHTRESWFLRKRTIKIDFDPPIWRGLPFFFILPSWFGAPLLGLVHLFWITRETAALFPLTSDVGVESCALVISAKYFYWKPAEVLHGICFLLCFDEPSWADKIEIKFSNHSGPVKRTWPCVGKSQLSTMTPEFVCMRAFHRSLMFSF
jgi:hypothetical protein